MANELRSNEKGQITIRRAVEADFEGIWPILCEVIERGDTFAYDPVTTKDEGRTIWMETPVATYVAEVDGVVAGMCCVGTSPVADHTWRMLDIWSAVSIGDGELAAPCASTR
jgi:hypothetical protein